MKRLALGWVGDLRVQLYIKLFIQLFEDTYILVAKMEFKKIQ
uniref:Uncharacterized protein n=1 Tax=Rhizophora mucronata TaxID=61149 RepID=A0A2P2QR96_RHIMU